MKSEGFGDRPFKLKLGINRFGRSPNSDFQIVDPSVSFMHCDVELSSDEILVRDCGSTNGTFIQGNRIESGKLSVGETLRLGEVELISEATEVIIAIPRFEVPRTAPPVVRADGAMICPRHADVPSTHRCTFCREIMCEACVRRLRRRGGKILELCPKCSHRCERIVPKKKKKGLFGFLNETIKLPLSRARRRENALGE